MDYWNSIEIDDIWISLAEAFHTRSIQVETIQWILQEFPKNAWAESLFEPGNLALPDEPDSPNRDSSKASSTARGASLIPNSMGERHR